MTVNIIEAKNGFREKWPEHDDEKGIPHMKCGKCGVRFVRLYRPYGNFLRDDDQRCAECQSKKDWAWTVPCVSQKDGTVWGYTTCTNEDIDRWHDLPEKGEKPPLWGDWFGNREHEPATRVSFEAIDEIVLALNETPMDPTDYRGAMAFYGWEEEEYRRECSRRMAELFEELNQ